jgi:hypothetical protein
MIHVLRHHERVYFPPQVIDPGGWSRQRSRARATVLRHHLVDHGVVDNFGAHFYETR